jgi:hypothetical protein
MASAKAVEIDLHRLATMGYVTPDTPRTQIASEFRVIKRPILRNVYDQSAAPVERANLIMVTSSLPGEGKTFVAVNLAISMAMELDTSRLDRRRCVSSIGSAAAGPGAGARPAGRAAGFVSQPQ